MEKFYTTRLTGQPDHPTLYTPEVPVYLASEVDARIAELEAALKHIADPLALHTMQEVRLIAKSVL